MKRSTAVRHLVEMAGSASDGLRLRDTDLGWPLEELWVTGDLLTPAETLDTGSVVVVLDLPPEELPWLALHPAGLWIADDLRLGKRPMTWSLRPLLLPVWNHDNTRLVRFWSADGGLDDRVIQLLQERQLDRLDIVEPSPAALVEQIREELALSRRHLRSVLGQYWEREWRGEHKGYDESPEDHLWRAAQAVSDMLDALEQLER